VTAGDRIAFASQPEPTERYATTQSILPRVISAIGAKDFAAVTAGALCEFLGFDLTAVFFHRNTGAPAIVCDNFSTVEGRVGIENYIRFTHRINPMLARASRAGVYRARDFAAAPGETRGAGDSSSSASSYVELNAREELGFRTVGWPRRQEEVCLYLEAGAGLFELGFYRMRGRSAAPAGKIRTLQALSAPIAAAFDRHEALRARDGQVAREARDRTDALSPREREIYDLLLLGCSSATIALRLGLSRYTVKDHRKHIFRKLRIGSLGELFALGSRSH
jgi:DNA-binding CsgD family transcriptional regulator